MKRKFTWDYNFQLTLLERIDFHSEINDKLDSIVLPSTLMSIEVPSTSTASSSSTSSTTNQENSLFQDYFNNSVDDVQYDELENYIAVVIPPVSHSDKIFFRISFLIFLHLNFFKTEQFDWLKWWYQYRNKFPKLYYLFLDTCCVPASSAPSERVFSYAGNVMTKKRNRLKPGTLQSLCRAKINL